MWGHSNGSHRIRPVSIPFRALVPESSRQSIPGVFDNFAELLR